MSAEQTEGTIRIDGHQVPFTEGQTVMQAALAAGVTIPRLCYRPELPPIGSCRMCVVKVGGRVMSACTSPAVDGQEIASASLDEMRTRILDLMLERGQHNCRSCERTGDCRLQEEAARLGSTPPPSSQTFVRDDSHPEVAYDPARCILCGVCVHASRILDGKAVFALVGSGIHTRLAAASDSGLLKDTPVSAGDHAIRLCPTGALVTKPQPLADPSATFDSFEMFDWSR